MEPIKKEPHLTLGEEIGNAITHGIGVLFSIVVLILLLIKSDSLGKYFGTYIYFFGIFILYSMSCLYHSFKRGSKVKKIFRRFDHCSIYLLIGGTFAPILIVYFGNLYGIIFLIIQWTIILLAITFLAVFGPNYFKKLHMLFYLLLGWSGLLLLPVIYKQDKMLLWLILFGGIVYSVGVIFFALKVKYSHFIWHFFVLAGTVLQFLGIYLYVF